MRCEWQDSLRGSRLEPDADTRLEFFSERLRTVLLPTPNERYSSILQVKIMTQTDVAVVRRSLESRWRQPTFPLARLALIAGDSSEYLRGRPSRSAYMNIYKGCPPDEPREQLVIAALVIAMCCYVNFLSDL